MLEDNNKQYEHLNKKNILLSLFSLKKLHQQDMVTVPKSKISLHFHVKGEKSIEVCCPKKRVFVVSEKCCAEKDSFVMVRKCCAEKDSFVVVRNCFPKKNKLLQGVDI